VGKNTLWYIITKKKFHQLQFGIAILESITAAVYDKIFAGPVAINVAPAGDNGVHVEYVFLSFSEIVNYDPVFSADSSAPLLIASWPCILLSLLLSLLHL